MKKTYSYRREEQKYTTPIFLPSSIVIYKYKINQLINMISSSYTFEIKQLYKGRI